MGSWAEVRTRRRSRVGAQRQGPPGSCIGARLRAYPSHPSPAQPRRAHASPASPARRSMGSLHGLVAVQAGEADGAALEGAQVDQHEGARRAEVRQGDDAHALAVVALDERLRVGGLVGGKVDVRALLVRVMARVRVGVRVMG